MTWRLAAILATLAAASKALAAPPVAVSVSTTAAELGKPMELSAQAPDADALALDLAASTTDSFAITKVEAAGPKAVRVEVLPLGVGRLPIPLKWDVTRGGRTEKVESEPLWLDVAGPPVGPQTEIADIRGPARARPLIWPWIAAVLAAAAAYLAYKRWSQTPEAAIAAAPVDTRAAEVVALEELERLRRSSLWSQRRFKEFYAELTDVARRYLERRYEIPATRLTTAELARHLKQSEVDRAVVLALRSVCDRADLVKFAKALPDEGWGTADIDGIAEVVRRTAPPPPAPPEVPV